MDNQEPQKKKKTRSSKGSRVNALVILICVDLIGFMASLYVLKAAGDANLFLIPAALTLVVSVITAMVYVQMRHQDEEDRQRIAGDVADALSAIIQITKNDQQLMDKKIDDLSEEYQVPAQEIINALKALAKVSLGRSKENATALINSNEAVVTQVMDLQDRIDSLEKEITKVSDNDLSKVIDDNSHKVVVGLDDLTHDVQRLDQDMRRLEKVTKDMELHAPVISGTQAQSVSAEKAAEKEPQPLHDPYLYDGSKELNEETTFDEPYIPANEDEEAVMADQSTDDDLTALLDSGTEDTDDVETGDDDLDLTIDDEAEDQEIGPDDLNLDLDTPTDEADATVEAVQEPEAEPSVQEAEPVEEEPVIEATEAEPEPEALTEPADEIPAAEPDAGAIVEPEAEAATEPEAEPTPAAEPEPAPEIDLSDPNKQLSPDEIAALFAQASKGPEPEEEPVIDEQPVSEENVPADTADNASDNTADADESTPAPATATESSQASAPAPDTSGDPNRMMTPEEIEALFSNVS